MKKKYNGFYINQHSFFLLQYHLVLITKYNNPVIVGDLKKALIDYTKKYFKERDINILEIDTDKNYIHIMFESYPNMNLSTFINAYKSASSRRMRTDFANFLKTYYSKPYFWSKSYFICTVNENSIINVHKYIKSQEN